MNQEKDYQREFDDDEDIDDYEFIPCSECDGHLSCEDFGCAIEHGLGRMVKKYLQPGEDHWG